MAADQVVQIPIDAPKPLAEGEVPKGEVVFDDGKKTAVRVSTEEPKEGEKPTEKPAEEKPAESQKTSEVDPKTATQEKAAEAVSKAGLDFNEFSKEYAEHGKLSDESLKKLEDSGIPRATVDAYIEGQKAQAALLHQRLAEVVGGTENLEATLEWAGKSLSQDEIDAANLALQSGNEALAKLTLTALHARREATVGKAPSRVSGRSAPGGGTMQGYESTEQMVRDMSKPEYREDPAFRKMVMDRIAASSIL